MEQLLKIITYVAIDEFADTIFLCFEEERHQNISSDAFDSIWTASQYNIARIGNRWFDLTRNTALSHDHSQVIEQFVTKHEVQLQLLVS